MKWLTILGLGATAGLLFLPRRGFCVETIGGGEGRCVRVCYRDKKMAKREVAEVWGRVPYLKARVIESKNTLFERRC